MSSILDALNKLEQEKAQVEQEDEIDRDIDPRQAARELIDGLPGPSRSIRLTPAALLVGGVIFTGLMIAVSVGVTVAIVNRAPAAAPAQTSELPERAPVAAVADAPPPAEPQPEPEPVVAAIPEAAVEEPQPEPAATLEAQVPAQETRIAALLPAPRPEPVRVEPAIEPPPAVEAAPIATEPEPEPEPAIVPEPVRVAPEPEPVVERRPITTARREPEPEPAPVVTDIRKLPPLTPSVGQRYGADPIQINMISPASATRPYAYAIINRIKVTVGDYIGGSRLKLVEVENHGIAVEAGSERYYVAF